MRPPALVAILLLGACTSAPRVPPAPPPTAPPGVTGAARYGPEPTVDLTDLEQAAAQAAAERLASGNRRPRLSPALALAARRLALRAADGDPSPLARPKLRAALDAALSYDPAPAAFVASGPPAELVDRLARAMAPRDASHVGAGAASRGGSTWLVVLVSRRAAVLAPFPREVPPGARVRLRGELVGLAGPRVFATLPSGSAEEMATRGARPFEALVAFGDPGRYVIEVVGDGPGGPDVAALLEVSCGGVPLDAGPERPPSPEPDDPAAAEAQVIEALDAARHRHGLAPLEPSAALRDAARRHSAEMLARRQLAHALPGSGDAAERLRRARIPYRAVLENIALGPTSLAAHQAAEESPAHLENILSPIARRVGVGIARGRLPTGEPVVYLTELFVQPVDDGSDGPLAPETRVREVLWRERERRGLPPLLADPALDEMAREAARAMLARDEPSADGLPGRALALGRKVSAADAFVAPGPGEAARSRNLARPGFRRVGVGVVVGDSPRFGAGLLWMAVVYTD